MPILSIPDTSSSPLLVTPVEDGKWGCKADGSELASKSRRDDGTNKTKHFYRHSSSITNSSFSSSAHKHALKSYTLMVIISKERIYHLYTVRSFNVCNTKFHGRGCPVRGNNEFTSQNSIRFEVEIEVEK